MLHAVDLDSPLSNESYYNDPKSVRILEKYGDIGMWLIPASIGVFSLFKGYFALAPVLLSAGIIQRIVIFKLKERFPRMRPRPFLYQQTTLEDIQSFPSSHTAGAFLGVGLSASLFRLNLLTITTCALATLVGLSRYFSKKHWSSDICCGALIGFFNGFISGFAAQSLK